MENDIDFIFAGEGSIFQLKNDAMTNMTSFGPLQSQLLYKLRRRQLGEKQNSFQLLILSVSLPVKTTYNLEG